MRLKTVSWIVFFALLASPAMADTIIDTYPSWSGDVTSGHTFTAQTFTAPTTDNELLSFKFGIQPRETDGNLTFSIYNWAGFSPVGSSLFSITLPWLTTTTEIIIPGINLALTSGDLYGAVMDLQGYTGQSIHWVYDAYPGGMALFGTSISNLLPGFGPDVVDLQFRAEFGAAPVPEPSTMLLLGFGLIGLWGFRRKLKK